MTTIPITAPDPVFALEMSLSRQMSDMSRRATLRTCDGEQLVALRARFEYSVFPDDEHVLWLIGQEQKRRADEQEERAKEVGKC